MHTMHLLPSIQIQPNLELKTRPKQLLGSLRLVTALPELTKQYPISFETNWQKMKIQKIEMKQQKPKHAFDAFSQ
jgi:hypothetical protein